MDINSPAFIGIDPTAGRHSFTYAAFDSDFHLVTLAAGELDELLAYLVDQPEALAAVNAPPRPNRGLVRELMTAAQPLARLRGADMRLVEYDLHRRGIAMPPTPSRAELCAAWIQMGFDLHQKLDGLGYRPFPDDKVPCQRLETNPHAIFCALLGQIPLPKPTLEGRLQRQLALHEQGAGVADPMDFFEEITRHKMLRGILPMEYIYATEELDALAAAFTAWCVANRPDEITITGERMEGQIVIPVKELMEQYT